MILPVPYRPYEIIAARLCDSGSRDERMQSVVDAIWDALAEKGITWVGFYVDRPDASDEERLVLGPYRDTPACSPIGLHGVCGQAVRFQHVRIVEDVTKLGSDYIACNPKDRSEIALPLVDDGGVCWGVLDLDSWDEAAFNETDDRGLRQILDAAGL